MYTLYWSPNSASLAPHCCLEEAGASYALKKIDQGAGEHRSAEYLKLNPAGKIPTLAIDNNFIMTESAAMCMLIADRYPAAKLAPEAKDLERGHFYMWLTHLTNTLQPAILRFYYADRHTSAADGTKAVIEKAQEEVAILWQRIEDHLKAKGPYLLGDRFSAADLFCTMLSTWQDPCPNTYDRFPHVKKLAGLVSARPAVAKIIKLNDAG